MAIFHPYIAYGAAFDYAASRNLDANKVKILQTGLLTYQESIRNHSINRNRDIKVKIRPKRSSSL